MTVQAMKVLSRAVKLSETLYTEAQKIVPSDAVSCIIFVISTIVQSHF